MKAAAERLALFTYSWLGGAGLDGRRNRVAVCRITADYASKDGLQVLDRAGDMGCKGLVICRITRDAARATKTFFWAVVSAPRKFLTVF